MTIQLNGSTERIQKMKQKQQFVAKLNIYKAIIHQ